MKTMRKVFNTEVKDINEQEMSLTALVSTNAIDRMEESLDPMGVDLKNYRNNPVVLWAHNYEMPPIGKALWVKRTKDGVISKVKFAETEFAQEIFGLYKGGFLNAFSVGFIPKKWDDGKEKAGKGPRRTYTEWEMLEYSAVPVPANPEALQLAMQKGILKSDNLIEEIQKQMDDGPEEEPEEPKNEPLTSTSLTGKTVELNPALDELIAENEQYVQQVAELEKQVGELKYKLYLEMTKNQERLSEIAEGAIADKVCDILDGAIRKATGKV